MAQQLVKYFYDEARRAETFQNFHYPDFAAELARNGFIFTNEQLVCVFCFETLKRLNAKTNIVKRHFTQSKNCLCYTNFGNKPIDNILFENDQDRYNHLKRKGEIKELQKKMKMLKERC